MLDELVGSEEDSGYALVAVGACWGADKVADVSERLM